MDTVNTDVLRLILERLDVETKYVARFVCKRWYNHIPKQRNTQIRMANFVTSLTLVKWARKIGLPSGDDYSISVGRNGNLDIYRESLQNGGDLYLILRGAASKGHLAFIQQIYSEQCQGTPRDSRSRTIHLFAEFAIRQLLSGQPRWLGLPSHYC